MSGIGPTQPTWAVQQVGSYLGYTGRGASVVAKAAFDPKLPSTACNEANVHGQAKHSLAKVSGAAASGLSLFGAMV